MVYDACNLLLYGLYLMLKKNGNYFQGQNQ